MPTYSFHSSDSALLAQIDARAGSRSEVIETALSYYFLLLADARRSLKAALTAEEMSLVCDALNGTLIEPQTVKYLRQEIGEAARVGVLGEKWGVSLPALDKKLARMALAEMVALADAVRRFWRDDADRKPVEFLD